MASLTENQLPYAMAILDSLGNRSVLKEELNKYPEEITDWLFNKDLLVISVLMAEGIDVETRVVLGIRATNLRIGYIERLQMLRIINNG